ncbi:CRISPR-associated protein Cas4 [Acidisoma cellulosilytica]|uniref:CRISPR-associated exonuclease Cas4 n=1 Tax=Acidisoma cellulosilyticum TaxID=2802395 RepID=A0A964E2M3_9PROT|nr:CRISPR-associated protein Cas4 [Acidisoma cellulosilyticum]MCB8879377.1 CRISPR-associated protein Cas4 [Acidisoma cellulosilyticum]
MTSDADLIALSALQHYLFCPRQCALIHIEQLWAENAVTAEGRVAHERVHATVSEIRRGVRTVTGMPLRSDRLGVTGVADVVELHATAAGGWRPYPVEHKRGRPKAHRADEVQLCAQAFALEEMFAVEIAEGALFYGEPRRRTVVAFDAALRDLTRSVAADTSALLAGGRTPRMGYEKKRCDACSLIDICRPRVTGAKGSVAAWFDEQLQD